VKEIVQGQMAEHRENRVRIVFVVPCGSDPFSRPEPTKPLDQPRPIDGETR
jgi:hypothetical protein